MTPPLRPGVRVLQVPGLTARMMRARSRDPIGNLSGVQLRLLDGPAVPVAGIYLVRLDQEGHPVPVGGIHSTLRRAP